MSLLTEWSETFTVSGVGSQTLDTTVFGDPARGRVNAVVIRSFGSASSLDSIWLVHTPAVSLILGTPADEYVIGEGGPLALVSSATDNSGRTPIDCPPAFSQGLGVVIAVTGSGTWVVTVTLELTELEGTPLNASGLNS